MGLSFVDAREFDLVRVNSSSEEAGNILCPRAYFHIFTLKWQADAMTLYTMPVTHPLAYAVYRFFSSFPIACFFLALLTDVAYWQTTNLIWLHFSEWLLLAGLVFGAVAIIVALIALVARWYGPTWFGLLGQGTAFALAVLNSFIHTADGWTAVMPYGLTVSIATVLVMAVAGLAGRRGGANV